MKKSNLILLFLALALASATVQIIHLERKVSEAPKQINKSEIVLENIHARKSVRKFTQDTISDSLITVVLKAAMAAPTGHDARPWQFIVTRNKKVMQQLRSNLQWARGLDYSTVAIIVCGDLRKVNPENPEFWITDCSAATQNLLLAAEALGLGAVWSTLYPGDKRMQHARQVMNLPDYLMPLCVIPMGYPLEETKPKVKFDPKAIHWEVYNEAPIEKKL